MGTLDGTSSFPINREMATLDGTNNIILKNRFVRSVPFLETRNRDVQTFTYTEVFNTLTTFN